MTINWEDFFQLSNDDTFDILEQDGIIAGSTNTKLGDGKVLERSGNQLVLELSIPSQTIELTGFLVNLFGLGLVDVPLITANLSLTILDLDDGNRLEVSGTFVDSNNVTQSFDFTDTNLEASLRNGGDRIRLKASDSFLQTISNDSNIKSLGRLEFEKTGDPRTTEIDVGSFTILGLKIDLFLKRN